MDSHNIAKRYLDAWNQKDVQAIMNLTHSQVSFFDAFWGETCHASDLRKFLTADFEVETRWYKFNGDLLSTPNGVVVRYAAFENSDPQGLEPVYYGAEVLTISGDLIITISDFYCDTDLADLVEVATFVEMRHARANTAPLGLSARVGSLIRKNLKALADEATVFLEPTLTVT